MSLALTDRPEHRSSTADDRSDIAPAPSVPAVRDNPNPPGRTAAAGLRSVASTVAWGLLGAAVFVALWHLGAGRVDNMPTPAETLTTLRSLLADAFHNGGPGDKGVGLLLKESLFRVFSGFAIAAVIGIPLGMAMGSSPRAWKAFNPLAQFLRPISPLAWYPVLLIVFLDANRASTWVICLTSLWPIVLNTAAGAATVPADQRNVARVFHLRRTAYIRHVLVPHTTGSIVTGLRLSMGTAWMVIVAVEMMSGRDGIGNYVWNSYNGGAMAKVAASILLIGATGLVLDLAFMRLAKLANKHEALTS